MVCDENASKWNAPKWNRAKVGHVKLARAKLARAKLNAPNWHDTPGRVEIDLLTFVVDRAVAYNFRPKIYRIDGLANIKYEVHNTTLLPLYTWLLVEAGGSCVLFLIMFVGLLYSLLCRLRTRRCVPIS